VRSTASLTLTGRDGPPDFVPARNQEPTDRPIKEALMLSCDRAEALRVTRTAQLSYEGSELWELLSGVMLVRGAMLCELLSGVVLVRVEWYELIVVSIEWYERVSQ